MSTRKRPGFDSAPGPRQGQLQSFFCCNSFFNIIIAGFHFFRLANGRMYVLYTASLLYQMYLFVTKSSLQGHNYDMQLLVNSQSCTYGTFE